MGHGRQVEITGQPSEEYCQSPLVGPGSCTWVCRMLSTESSRQLLNAFYGEVVTYGDGVE